MASICRRVIGGGPEQCDYDEDDNTEESSPHLIQRERDAGRARTVGRW